MAEIRALSLIKIFTRSETRACWIADRLKDVDIDIRITSAEDAVLWLRYCCLPLPHRSHHWFGMNGSEKELIFRRWALMTRASTNSIRAILKRARLFADNPRQSIVIGEFQHAYDDGLINSADDICALGLVTLGKSPGRISDSEITVFDSSGIAIQDLAVAGAIFESAQQMGEIQNIDF